MDTKMNAPPTVNLDLKVDPKDKRMTWVHNCPKCGQEVERDVKADIFGQADSTAGLNINHLCDDCAKTTR